MADADAVGSTLQVVVVGLLSVLVVVVIAVYSSWSFLGAARFLATTAANGAVQVEGIVSSAVAQGNAIIEGARNTVQGISKDVANAVVTGLQLIFGAITSIGKGVLNAITEGAAAITDILIELVQNLATTFVNFLGPVSEVIVMYGNVFNDILSALQSAFGPITAIVNGTLLLTCCVSQAVKNFPGVPSFVLPGNCVNITGQNDCGCLCSSCDSVCTDCPCVSGQTCSCPASVGKTPCCPAFF